MTSFFFAAKEKHKILIINYLPAPVIETMTKNDEDKVNLDKPETDKQPIAGAAKSDEWDSLYDESGECVKIFENVRRIRRMRSLIHINF